MGNKTSVEGIFVSDSAILFVRNCDDEIECLKVILRVIKGLNEKMLGYDLMLTTSIACGHFKYQKRIESEGIEKNPIYGNAYISAFLNGEIGKPRIQPRQCRIVRQGLLNELVRSIESNNSDEYFVW